MLIKFLKILLPKGVCDKYYPDALKVNITETGVKLDVESLLINDAITKHMQKIKSILK